MRYGGHLAGLFTTLCFTFHVTSLASHDQVVQIQLKLDDQSVSSYPQNLSYTQHHIWFGPDPANDTQTLMGMTSWPIAHVLHDEIDGGVILPDRGDLLEAGQSMGRFVGETDKESFELIVPFTAVFVKPNVDLDLDEMVKKPYSEHGYLAVLDRPPPKFPPKDTLFFDSIQYERYLNQLR